jgi:threonine dehydrogenase-like Zn-dependent dehydrogenase
VPDPKIEHPRDAVIRITACAICGSDLHLLDGYQPTMESGDILGHENMGEVMELGSEVTNLKKGATTYRDNKVFLLGRQLRTSTS